MRLSITPPSELDEDEVDYDLATDPLPQWKPSPYAERQRLDRARRCQERGRSDNGQAQDLATVQWEQTLREPHFLASSERTIRSVVLNMRRMLSTSWRAYEQAKGWARDLVAHPDSTAFRRAASLQSVANWTQCFLAVTLIVGIAKDYPRVHPLMRAGGYGFALALLIAAVSLQALAQVVQGFSRLATRIRHAIQALVRTRARTRLHFIKYSEVYFIAAVCFFTLACHLGLALWKKPCAPATSVNRPEAALLLHALDEMTALRGEIMLLKAENSVRCSQI